MTHRGSSLPYWRLSGFYFVWAAVIGALMPYWGLYLAQRGFDEPAIGSLMAILAATHILTPYLLGYLADRTGRRMGLIRLSTWLALLCFGGVFVDGGVAWLALVMLVFGCFWNAMAPQFETVTLAYLHDQPGRYSQIRLWGSLGFIASVLLLAALRWTLIGTFPEQPVILLFAQCLHAASFGSFHAAAIETIRRRFRGSHAGQGQALYSSLCVGLGNTLGAFYSGLLWQPLGAIGTFGTASLLALLGAWLYWQQPNAKRSIEHAYESLESH